jgi:hypothetical protein
LLANIKVGKAIDSKSNVARIQLNSALKSIDDIADFIVQKRSGLPAEKVTDLVAYLDIDIKTKMAIVNKIKERLQQIEQYEVAYSALESE